MAKRGLPPSPVLLKKEIPEKYRRIAFAPLLLAVGFLTFALVGLILQEFELALLAGLIVGPVTAWALVGPPFTRGELGKLQQKLPKAPPEKRPLLFFPAMFIAAALLYIVVGFIVTSTSLDADVLALLALGVALPAGIAVGYLLYGFPKPKGRLRDVKSPLERVPPEKRPFLFFPLGLLIAAPLYFLLGFALTEVLNPDIAVLIALLLGLVLGFAAAYRLVGVPKTAALRARLKVPEVPKPARGPVFVAFVLLVGSLFALLLGGTVGATLEFINADLAFPLFLLAGWLLAVPLAGRLFGYPVPDRPLREYVPKLTSEQRPAALLPLTLGLGLVFTLLLGSLLGLVPLADLEDAYLSALLGFPLALLVSLRLLGVSRRELDPRGLDRIPERARPLVVLGIWLFVGTLLFTGVAQVLTTFLVGAAVSYAAGLAVALLLVDRGGLVGGLGRRKAQKRKAAEIEARLRREMGLAAPEPQGSAAGGEGRFRRRRGKA